MGIRLTETLIETVGAVRNARVYAQWMLTLNPVPNSVLDIGCGDGVVREELPPGVSYQGIDIGADIYTRAEDPSIRYISNYEALKAAVLEAEPVDAVLLLDVLEHTPDGAVLLEHAASRAQKYILVALPNELRLMNLLDIIFRDRMLGAHGFGTLSFKPGHRHQWLVNIRESVSELPKRVEPYGFRLVRLVHFVALPSTGWKRLTMRLLNLILPWRLKATNFALLFSR